MKKLEVRLNADEYVASFTGWRRFYVERLRSVAVAIEGVEEAVKWGHLVYECGGPAFLVRVEADRILFGFWRGKRMLGIEPRLKPGGKYEMARMEIRETDSIPEIPVEELMNEAKRLNLELGDPRND